MVELCLMCERYLTLCTKEEIRLRKNETWDGFKVIIESCPDYVRAQIQHKEE